MDFIQTLEPRDQPNFNRLFDFDDIILLETNKIQKREIEIFLVGDVCEIFWCFVSPQNKVTKIQLLTGSGIVLEETEKEFIRCKLPMILTPSAHWKIQIFLENCLGHFKLKANIGFLIYNNLRTPIYNEFCRKNMAMLHKGILIQQNSIIDIKDSIPLDATLKGIVWIGSFWTSFVEVELGTNVNTKKDNSIEQQDDLGAISIESTDTKENGLCAICIDQQACIVFHSCGHLCICETCFKNFKPNCCPICRSISSTQKVFFT